MEDRHRRGSRKENDDDNKSEVFLRTSLESSSTEYAPNSSMELVQQHSVPLSEFWGSDRHDLFLTPLSFRPRDDILTQDHQYSHPQQEKRMPDRDCSASSLEDLLKLSGSVACAGTESCYETGEHADTGCSHHDVRLAAALPVAASFHPIELFENISTASPATSEQVTSENINQPPQNLAFRTIPYNDHGALHRTCSANCSIKMSPQEALFRATSSQVQLGNTAQPGVRHMRPGRVTSAAFQAGIPHVGPAADPFNSDDAVWRMSASNHGLSLEGTALLHDFGAYDSQCGDPIAANRGLAGMYGSNSTNVQQEGVLASSGNLADRLRPLSVSLESTDHTIRLVKKTPSGAPSEVFPVTLHRLLMDLEKIEGGRDIARFTYPHGKSFIVQNPDLFESDVMPMYFPRMNRFASFQRQLNLYDFARVLGRDTPDRGSYYHESFLRDQPVLACTIRRRKIKGLFTVPLEKRRYKRKGGSPP